MWYDKSMPLKDPIKRKEYEAQWLQSPAGRAYLDRTREKRNKEHRDYSKSEKGRLVSRNKSKRMRAKYPEKFAARTKLRYAVKTGKVIKLPCEMCGDIKSQGHHSDYSKPLDVQWLCDLHHKHVEGKLKLKI